LLIPAYVALAAGIVLPAAKDVPAEDATQNPYPLQVDRHEFRPVRDENPDDHRYRWSHYNTRG